MCHFVQENALKFYCVKHGTSHIKYVNSHEEYAN